MDYTEKFLAIANNRAAYEDNEPARLIFEAIEHYAEVHEITEEEAAVRLSVKPYYGSNGEVGGVNVFKDEEEITVVFTTSDISTWTSLVTLVCLANDPCPNGVPDWFEAEWYSVL